MTPILSPRPTELPVATRRSSQPSRARRVPRNLTALVALITLTACTSSPPEQAQTVPSSTSSSIAQTTTPSSTTEPEAAPTPVGTEWITTEIVGANGEPVVICDIVEAGGRLWAVGLERESVPEPGANASGRPGIYSSADGLEWSEEDLSTLAPETRWAEVWSDSSSCYRLALAGSQDNLTLVLGWDMPDTPATDIEETWVVRGGSQQWEVLDPAVSGADLEPEGPERFRVLSVVDGAADADVAVFGSLGQWWTPSYTADLSLAIQTIQPDGQVHLFGSMEPPFGGSGIQQVDAAAVFAGRFHLAGFLTGGEHGQAAVVWHSDDGISWEMTEIEAVGATSTGYAVWVDDMVSGPTGLLVAGSMLSPADNPKKRAVIWHSPDGYQWNRIDLDTSDDPPEQGPAVIVATEAGYLVFENSYSLNPSQVWTSPDGVAWQLMEGHNAPVDLTDIVTFQDGLVGFRQDRLYVSGLGGV